MQIKKIIPLILIFLCTLLWAGYEIYLAYTDGNPIKHIINITGYSFVSGGIGFMLFFTVLKTIHDRD